ncbi:accessory Sec system S-layer assembly protein [Halalkalibacter nanhaiisediminis]|uniref:Accessory Sec system S-layer assembly protein n=1 Tax=Halalkalibacter nanhaiisediminis TaxID=688079 RepID=A0A562QUB4_9BACI|nr:accessory Sec system S-layer assembly protein [Halalkalibacter nanhaiisediminis]TWI59830.1 accessory Sec system S-layer assembly protein [Halalkalibacter nanhaiisediminis]
MGIFSKRDNNEQPKLEGKENAVSSSDLLNEESTTEQNKEIQTELSIHSEWELPKEDIYAYQFLNMECTPLKPNQLSLSGINLDEEKEGLYRVTAFVRNSLDKAIKLEETTLVLVNKEGQTLGRKAFDLSELGEIPARSSRPWHFYFTHKDLFTQELPREDWQLAFQLKPSSRKHSLDLEASWEKSLAEDSKARLEEVVNNLTPPKEGEVNFMGLQVKKADNGDLHVTLLIRNGSEKNINLEQIPLQVEDANGDVVAKGGFKLDHLTVKANTSKPWTFIFPKAMIVKEDADFSKWKAYAPTQK